MTPGLLLRDVELRGRSRCDVRVRDRTVVEVGTALSGDGDEVVAGAGGALLPGLADHHLHLAAVAATTSSVDLAPVPAAHLRAVLGKAEPDRSGWVRAVGYDDGSHGDLTRRDLDAWRPDVPVRVQHRSGALWVLNGRALDALGNLDHPGVEHDQDRTPTGRLWRADDWLGASLGRAATPSLVDLGSRLASYGITHVTDASPTRRPADLAAAAAVSGELRQHLLLMAADVVPPPHPRVRLGPVKIVAADHDDPDLDDLVGRICSAREAGRAVAVHCVTRVSLVLTLAALDIVGTRPGDRIEHCAVADTDLAREIARRGLTVVTQPSLLARRGDDYWSRSEPADRDALWPYAALLGAGVRVAPSSDAPYGDPDPWATIRAATTRTTPTGRVVGAAERVPAEVVLDGFLASPDDPGGQPRRVEPGAPADLVLLHVPCAEALARPDSAHVRATWIEGCPAHRS